MVKQILQNLNNHPGLILFNPASNNDIVKLNHFLTDYKALDLPEDYQDFLRLTDGLIFNDLELYGCHCRARPGYEFPSIEFIYKLTLDNSFFRNNIILGLLSEEIVVYNYTNSFYSLIDRVTLDYLIQYSSFKELLAYLTVSEN